MAASGEKYIIIRQIKLSKIVFENRDQLLVGMVVSYL